MKAKKCCRCKMLRSITEFCKNRTSPDGLSYECRVCRHSRYTDHVERRKKQTRISARRREELARALVLKHYASNPCVDCGETDPIVLEFDHVRGEKVTNISRMINTGRPLALIQEEISKCEVRCANCHRRVTHQRRGVRQEVPTVTPLPARVVPDHGVRARYIRGCRCPECRQANKDYGRTLALREPAMS